MQIIRAIFYILFIINGGFRHFGFEYSFFSKIHLNNYSSDLHLLITRGEEFVFILVILTLIFNRIKWLDLVIFIVLFILDVYFQNFIKFESSIILVHFVPLLFFLSNKMKDNKKTAYIILLFLSVGFSSSALSKILSGWLNWNDTVIYSYVVEFNKGYNLPSILGNILIDLHLPFYFWKMCDYITVFFQFSFLLLFFNVRFYRYLLPLATIFHFLILLFLGITVFFPYMIVYLYVIFLMKKEYILNEKWAKLTSFIISTIGLFFLGVIIYSNFDLCFLYQNSSEWVYLYVDYIWNILLGISVFWFTFFHPSTKIRS